jgi:TPR repeat protein
VRRPGRGALVGLAIALATPALAQPANTPLPPQPPAASTAPPPASNVDLAYGAYERGFYLTAFNEAMKRAQQNDAAAMTLLGELYAQGLGVGLDDAKAAEWYRRGAAAGDPNAMFSLAMFNIAKRGGLDDRAAAVKLLNQAAKLGHVLAAYDLGLLYLQGQDVTQDFGRAAALFESAAQAGNPEAQFALATMYKQGRGVPQDLRKAAALLAQASIAGNVDAMVEFAIAQFNGTGTTKNESAAAQIFLKAAQRGSPIAQDRLSRILMAGRGMPADPIGAVKWHIIAKAAGAGDPELDVYAAKQPQTVRDAAEKAAKTWMSTLTAPRS